MSSGWNIKFDDKACEVLKIKEFTVVNDCFQNEHNEKIGHYRQTLINNTANDATPYVLTANHCSTSNDFAQWVFWFNWQSATCTNPGTSPARDHVTTSGSVLKARNGGSDFCLVQMNQTPPCTFNPYYSGWSRSTTPATSACGIHHPSADIKKISLSTQSAISASYSGVDSWQILWGVQCTEPGSSGSPIYDQDHRIIGQLYGGPSACGLAQSSMNDYYGKVATSWAGGGTSATRLSDWLDPLGTTPQFIDGYNPCLSNPPVANFSANPTSTCSGVVQFTDMSSYSPTSWLWDFGDGQTSTTQNPQYTYTSNGTYTISLTVTNGIGSDQITNTNYITINMPIAPTVMGGSNCGTGTVNLSATGTGTIHWFDAASGGTDLGTGNSFTTPSISSTTTYYAEDQITTIGNSQFVGSTDNNANGGFLNTGTEYWLIFDVISDMRLVSVDVNASGAGNRVITLRNSVGTDLQTITANLPAGISTVTLNWDIPTGSNYTLVGATNCNLWRNNANITYPYSIAGLVSITASNVANRYYYYYNWEVQQVTNCISPRVPVGAVINQIVTPSISISANNTTICQGDTVTFIANPINGGIIPQYQWQLNGNNVGPNSSSVTTNAFNNNDVIVCILTSSATCATPSTATSNSITMTVYPLAVSSFTFTVNQLDYTFTSTSTNATSYLWDFGDGTTSTAQNPTHTFPGPGSYNVTLTVYNSCGYNTTSQNITTTDIYYNKSNISLIVFPNPAKDNLTLEVILPFSEKLNIEILDFTGRLIYKQNCYNTLSNSKINIDLSDYEKGIYILNVKTNRNNKTIKFIHE